MRLLISFILSLLIYSVIVYFFIFFIIPKNEKKQEVLIHTAIIPQKSINNQKIKKKKNIINNKVVKKIKRVEKKVKKSGSKTNIKKGGEVDFNDIFKNVKANIDTTPVKLKKYEEMSRFKGIKRVQKLLKNVKNVNVNVEFENKSTSKMSEEKISEIINKIGEIWYDISVIPGEYAKINVINQNGKIYVTILDSNLDWAKQEELIERIKNLSFNENFDINVLFQTKVNK